MIAAAVSGPCRIADRPGSTCGARSWTACSRRGSRRPPTAIPGACSRRCATRCWRPASASARCSRSPRPRPSRAGRRRRAARLRRRRAGPLLLADPRRSAGDGRRRLPARAPEQPQGVRRGDRDPRRRRAADAGVRLDRRGGRARGAAAPVPGGVARALRRRRARSGWCAGRRAISASRRPRRWPRWRRCTARRPRALFRAALVVGGCAGGAAPDALAALARFGDGLRRRVPARRRHRRRGTFCPRGAARATAGGAGRGGLRGRALARSAPRGDRLVGARARSCACRQRKQANCPAPQWS